MILASYIAACVAFYFAFVRLGLLWRVRELFSEFREAAATVRDPALSDLEKERRIRRAAVGTLGKSSLLVLRLATAFGAAALPVALSTLAGLDLETFTAFTLNPLVLAATAVVLAGIDRLRRETGS